MNTPSILVAGPWIGEFGYELFRWQGVVRQAVQEGNYDTVIVAARPGHEVLYQDFCTDFRPFAADINPCEGRFNTKETNLEELTQNLFADVAPFRIMCPLEKYMDDMDQAFVKFGECCPTRGLNVLLHARAIQVGDSSAMVRDGKNVKENRNWAYEQWCGMAKWLQKHMGVTVGCIGSPSASHHIPGTRDCRGVSLEQLAHLVSSSDVVVGPSSGPIHFASLCGTPQFVWGSPHLHKRYTQTWNPFNTKVHFHAVDDRWDPDLHQLSLEFKPFYRELVTSL